MIKNNKLLVYIGFAFLFIGWIGKTFYRDYIYSNDINDFGIAGFIPSYSHVIALSLMMLVKQTKYPILIFFFVTLGSIIYEFIQVKVWGGRLDVNDILASIGGGITASLIFWIVQRYVKPKKKWTSTW